MLDILFISVCAVICGTKSFVDIADFGVAKEGWLRRHLELWNGIPSHDTFRRVLSLLDPDALPGCFISWTGRLSEVTSGDIVVALEDKTLCRSFQETTGVGVVQVLNAFSSANGLSLGQVKVDEKSNEITAVPALLDMLDVSGAVVTADALNTQKEIAAKVIDKGADFCLALKRNHPALHDEARLYVESSLRDGFTERMSCFEEAGYDHGRSDLRLYLSSLEGCGVGGEEHPGPLAGGEQPALKCWTWTSERTTARSGLGTRPRTSLLCSR